VCVAKKKFTHQPQKISEGWKFFDKGKGDES